MQIGLKVNGIKLLPFSRSDKPGKFLLQTERIDRKKSAKCLVVKKSEITRNNGMENI